MQAVATSVGVGLAWVGAAAIVVGTVLVLAGPTSTGGSAVDVTRVVQGGWLPILGALGIAGAASWVRRGRRDAWLLPVCLCVLTSLPIVVTAADPEFGARHPWGSAQSAALLVAAVGVVVAFIGSLLLSRGPGRPDDSRGGSPSAPESNACPRCARPTPSADRTCANCGFAVGRYRSGSRR